MDLDLVPVVARVEVDDPIRIFRIFGLSERYWGEDQCERNEQCNGRADMMIRWGVGEVHKLGF